MKKTKKRQPLTDSQKQKRQKTAFKRKIRAVFTGAGFKYIPTNDHEMKIGLRKVEIDALFIYENVWLLCEDTVKTTNIKDHIRTKNEAAVEIKSNLSEYIKKLIEYFPDRKNILEKYDVGRISLFSLYIPRDELTLSEDDYKLFDNLRFVQPKTLDYFQWIVKCIRLSARYEIFRFLNLTTEQIGRVSSSTDSARITAPIIYPKEFTGIKSGIRVVSFMMKAEDLINMAYVLRKDNWEESIWLYQRLIEKSKIKSIRDFVEEKGTAFFNNIIVALPDDISFLDATGSYISIDAITALEGNCQLVLPKKLNSVCVIDGQHRIFAHYESGTDSVQEQKIAELRQELHLLVTGLVFPKDMSAAERARIQSEIFLDINSNTKKVPANVLLQIKRIKNPIADESIAQFVIEKLNKEGIFQNLLQISSLEVGKIKTASIVRFALRYLVTISPSDNKKSLFEFWNGDKTAFQTADEKAIQEYVKFCTDLLKVYFGAIRKRFKSVWDDPNSKLLSVTAINGFIIALNRQLNINGVKDFTYYDQVFADWEIEFSKEKFPYTSSQYRKFSGQILEEAFKLSIETIESL
ncbi:MAG: DGQHR domain-containing protein [Oscillospiraceae bacterium]|jgi:DGQHR domain-containing protein|nr:DGQHR domain-containing protein [Oscillospiraceae bacterium]